MHCESRRAQSIRADELTSGVKKLVYIFVVGENSCQNELKVTNLPNL